MIAADVSQVGPARIAIAWLCLIAGFLTAEAAGVGTADANPPGPGEPGYCGAHTDPLDCWANTDPATPGELAFIDQVRGHIPGDDTRLLQVARGTCQMLTGGAATWYVVQDLSERFGMSKASAGQLMLAAMDTACPGLVVGSDGVARPI